MVLRDGVAGRSSLLGVLGVLGGMEALEALEALEAFHSNIRRMEDGSAMTMRLSKDHHMVVRIMQTTWSPRPMVHGRIHHDHSPTF